MINHFKKTLLFVLLLIASPSFGVRFVGPVVTDLQDLVRIRDKGERDRGVIAYAEKYFSKNKSIEERVKSIRELGVIMGRPEEGWREGQNFSHLLFRLFNELSEVTPSNEVRQSLAQSFVGGLETKEDLEVFFSGVRFPPLTGIGYSSPKYALENFQEGLSKSVFQKGMVTLRQLSRNEDSRAIASELMKMAVDDYPTTVIPKEDFRFLFGKGAAFDENTLWVISKELEEEANNLFVSWLDSQRDLGRGQFNGVSDIQNRLSDWKSTLSDEMRRNLQKIIFDRNVTPEARASAFRVLQIKHPKSVEDSSEKLLNSKEALDHLVASKVLEDKPEYKDKMTELLQKDLLSTEDPRVLNLLSGSPLVKEAHWSSGAFTASEIEGVKRLISSRQSLEVRKILDVHPELTGLLTKGLKKTPETLSDVDFNQEFAGRLSKAIKEDPGLMTPQLRQEISEILLSKEPNLARTQNTFRKFMPENLIKELDQKITQKRLDPSNSDPCQVTCRIAAELGKKLNQSQVTPTIQAYDNPRPYEEEQGPMNLAIRSLTIEFLLKAKQTGCLIENVDELASNLISQARSLVTSRESEPRIPDDNDEIILKNLRSLASDSDSIERAVEFQKKRLSKGGRRPQLPTTGATLHAYIQILKLMNAFQKEGGGIADQKAFDDLKAKLEQKTSEIVEHRAGLEQFRGGSMLNTYAFSAMGAAASEGSPVSSRVSQILSDWRRELEEKKISGFPYSLSHRLETERGGAARSAVAQLAIYKGGSTADKLANADKLLLSLQTYDKHLLDVFARVGVSDTHDESNDGLAPYYGPPTLPYVFEAISLLSKETGMTSEQKKRLSEINESILNKTLGMIQPNGLFQPQDEQLYRAAKFYDNALVGLGLAQACTDSKPRAKTPAVSETRERRRTTPTH